jgi:thioesterase domain-containing protein/acyl carrier protein
MASPASDLEAWLQEVWAASLGLESVGLHDNYFDLGGDSLQAVALFLRIEEALGHRLPTSVLIEAGTVAQMAWYIENAPASGCLVPIQTKGDLAPFFCVHGLGGDVLCLRELARHLGEWRPFYGISNGDLDRREWRFPDLDAMATRYVSEIRKLQPAGPYFLGGYSLGGQVAYVMAQQLEAANEEVALLALIDAYSGIEGGLRRKPLPQWLDRHRVALAGLPLKDRPSYVLQRFRNIAANARKSLSHRMLLAARPKPIRGNAVLFKVERLTERYPDTLDNWHRLTQGRLQVVPVTGDHTTLLKEPHVRKLAEKLAAYLKESPPATRSANM